MAVEEFAVAFTFAVTEVSDPVVDFVAKNGKYSVFAILQEIFPQARTHFFLFFTLAYDTAYIP